MATVTTHQTATPFAGPVAGTTNRAADVLANDNALAAATNAHDADETIHVQSSTLAARPAAGVASRLWFTTDTREFWYDTGAAWQSLATVTGAIVFGAGVQITGNVIPATGVGLELRYDPAGGSGIYGSLSSIDRGGGGVYKPMFYSALTHIFALSGTRVLGMSSAGVWAGSSDPGGSEPFRVNGALRINSPTLLVTGIAFTDGAGAAVGTLTNAPAAGNPTKWIPINDSGTIRYLPAW